MRAAAVLAASLLAALPCAAEVVQGSGHAASRTGEMPGLERITVALPARIELRQDEHAGYAITADDNLLGRIEILSGRGELLLRFPVGLEVRPATPIRITIRARSPEWIALAGTAALEASKLDSQRLEVHIAGTAQITLPDIAVRELVLHATGHCHAMLGGRADSFELWVAGQGKGEFNAARLEARRADVQLAGSAQAVLWVHEKLRARVSGRGAVSYFGDPAVEKTLAYGGRLERLGAAPP